MKRLSLTVFAALVFMLLTGCSAKVTEESLMKHDWAMKTTTSEGVSLGLSLHFNEDTVTVSPRVISIDMAAVPADHKTLGESFYRESQEDKCQELAVTGSYQLKDGKLFFDVPEMTEIKELVKQELPAKGTVTFEKGKLIITGDDPLVFDQLKK